MILPIYSYGNSTLRKESINIDQNYQDLQILINNMFDTLYNAKGVALSAPQIGKNIKLIVIDTKEMSSDFPNEELSDFKIVMINPQIKKEFGDDFLFREACLSLPRLSQEINRPSKIIISYFDEKWNHNEIELTGIKCRVVQHSYDSLLGKLWIDKISPLRKKLLQSKLDKIKRGKVYVDYSMKFI